jgi:hypothetical protein
MATNDPVGLALASLGAGITAGAAVITTGMIVLRTVQVGAAAAEPSETHFTVLTITTFTGIVVAVAVGWVLSRALDDLWRRGVIGALSVFGMALVAGVAAPADMLAGRAGLAGYLAILLVGLRYTSARARRAALQ